MKNDQIIFETVSAAFTPSQILKLVEAIYPAGTVEKTAAGTICEGDPVETAVKILAADSFHTFQEWKRMGFSVMKGQHATLVCDLWQHTDKPGRATVEACQAAGQEAPEKSPHFYKKKSFLFSRLQVEPLKK